MKVTDILRVRPLVALALLGGLLALSPPAPARANSPSAWCYDDVNHPSVPLVTGNFGLPLWLAVENGTLDGTPGHVVVCYGTAAPGENKTIGGAAHVNIVPWSNGVSVDYGNNPDSNSANQNNFSGYAWPTYHLSAGGTGGGQELTFTVPVAVCSGPCQPATQPADGQTGVIIGSITQTPTSSGGTSAAYTVTGLCVEVDGTTVVGSCLGTTPDTGLTTTGTSPTNTSPATPGPCVVGICAPNFDYVGTTGNQIATLYVAGLGAVPVYGVHTCLYTKDASTPCPW